MKELFMTSPLFPVFLAAVDLEMPPAPRFGTVPSLSPHLTPGVAPVTTSKAECASKWNGLHSPVSLKPRLNLSIEVPSPSQVCVDGCRHAVSPKVALQQECDFSSPVTAKNGKKGYLSGRIQVFTLVRGDREARVLPWRPAALAGRAAWMKASS